MQSISNAHKLGCHHLAVSRDGQIAASIGFAGELKTWKISETGSGDWEPYAEVANGGEKAGEAWALALSEDGSVLATTTHNGRVNVWRLRDGSSQLVQQFEPGSMATGAFGMSVDISRDGKYTATGHENGAVYLYNNETGRVVYQLPGKQASPSVPQPSLLLTLSQVSPSLSAPWPFPRPELSLPLLGIP